jgi:cytochrome b pre-mRNA-processing protein 3
VLGRLLKAIGLIRRRPAEVAGERLYAAAAAQARQPGFYLTGGVADTPEGRFELYTLHVVLILHRLKRQGAYASEVGQALFDSYVSHLDHALRELGVGDLSVGKKMRKLGEAFYGRAKSYDTALSALPQEADLKALLGRTVLEGADAAKIEALAAYVTCAVDRLAAQPIDAVIAGDLAWPETNP